MNKKRFILLLITILLILLVGCDVGLEIVGLSIRDYPSKIVYIAGVDKQLDLSGGTIDIHCRNRKVYNNAMDNKYPEAEVSYSINFDVPGVYTVTLSRNGYQCSFPIQVIDKDYIEARLNQ